MVGNCGEAFQCCYFATCNDASSPIIMRTTSSEPKQTSFHELRKHLRKSIYRHIKSGREIHRNEELPLANLNTAILPLNTLPSIATHQSAATLEDLQGEVEFYLAVMTPKPVRRQLVLGTPSTEGVELPSPTISTGPGSCSEGIITHSNPVCKCTTCVCKRLVRRRDTNLCDYCYESAHSWTGS